MQNRHKNLNKKAQKIGLFFFFLLKHIKSAQKC